MAKVTTGQYKETVNVDVDIEDLLDDIADQIRDVIVGFLSTKFETDSGTIINTDEGHFTIQVQCKGDYRRTHYAGNIIEPPEDYFEYYPKNAQNTINEYLKKADPIKINLLNSVKIEAIREDNLEIA